MYGPCFSSIVGGHPLRSPTRHRLGKPLPYQLADGTQVPPKAPFGFPLTSLTSKSLCGISGSFDPLSPSSGQVTNALLTRSPLSLRTVRLACIRHAASVHPEPGSNSPYKIGKLTLLSVQVQNSSVFLLGVSYHYSAVKVRFFTSRSPPEIWRK